MREIKFRAKRVDNGEWIEGSLIVDPSYKKYYIQDAPSLRIPIEVIPESVGQFTGLLDKTGQPIYEGDRDSLGWVVVFQEGAFGLKSGKSFVPLHSTFKVKKYDK